MWGYSFDGLAQRAKEEAARLAVRSSLIFVCGCATLSGFVSYLGSYRVVWIQSFHREFVRPCRKQWGHFYARTNDISCKKRRIILFYCFTVILLSIVFVVIPCNHDLISLILIQSYIDFCLLRLFLFSILLTFLFFNIFYT